MVAAVTAPVLPSCASFSATPSAPNPKLAQEAKNRILLKPANCRLGSEWRNPSNGQMKVRNAAARNGRNIQ